MIKKLYIFILLSVLSLTGISYAIACGCGSQSNNSTSIQQSSQEQVTEEKVLLPS